MSTSVAPQGSTSLPPQESTSVAPEASVDASTPSDADQLLRLGYEPTRLIEFSLGAIVLFDAIVPFLPLHISMGQVAIAAGLFVAMMRPTRFDTRPLTIPFALSGLALVYVMLVSIESEVPAGGAGGGWVQRAVRIGLTLALMWSLVGGRLHYPSLIRGMVAGLIANAGLFFLGVAPAPYGAYLTGYLLDKNQAGLVYAIVPLLAMGVYRQMPVRVALLTIFVPLLWFTGSRTALAAFALGIVWLVARPFLGRFWRILLGLSMIRLVVYIEERFARVGAFSDRVESDWFRAQLDILAQRKTDASGFFGQGLGQAWVEYGGRPFFFHNSYLALLTEGGWPYAILVVGATVFYGIRVMVKGKPPTVLALAAEGGNIAVLMVATRLGEVFMDTTALLTLGLGFVAVLQTRALTHPDEVLRHTGPQRR